MKRNPEGSAKFSRPWLGSSDLGMPTSVDPTTTKWPRVLTAFMKLWSRWRASILTWRKGAKNIAKNWRKSMPWPDKNNYILQFRSRPRVKFPNCSKDSPLWSTWKCLRWWTLEIWELLLQKFRKWLIMTCCQRSKAITRASHQQGFWGIVQQLSTNVSWTHTLSLIYMGSLWPPCRKAVNRNGENVMNTIFNGYISSRAYWNSRPTSSNDYITLNFWYFYICFMNSILRHRGTGY